MGSGRGRASAWGPRLFLPILGSAIVFGGQVIQQVLLSAGASASSSRHWRRPGWLVHVPRRALENVNADMGVVIPHGAPFPADTKQRRGRSWARNHYEESSMRRIRRLGRYGFLIGVLRGKGSTRYGNRTAGPVDLARTGTRLIPQTRVAERRASPVQLYLPSSSRGTTRAPTPIEGSLSASQFRPSPQNTIT